jgi:hypothetical protein
MLRDSAIRLHNDANGPVSRQLEPVTQSYHSRDELDERNEYGYRQSNEYNEGQGVNWRLAKRQRRSERQTPGEQETRDNEMAD